MFGSSLKSQFILLLSLFLLLFVSLPHFLVLFMGDCTISANFYLYLQYFQQKNFNFSKINRSQADPKCMFGINESCQLILLFSLFLLLFMGLIAFLVLFMGFTVLLQLTFTFIYNTFSKQFSVSAK